MASPEEWYRSLPPVTRAYATAAVAATIVTQLGVLAPRAMILSFPDIFQNLELWRLATNLVFFGPFGFPFVMAVFFLLRYTKELETKRFQGRIADFVWAIFLMAATLTLIAFFAGFMLLSQPLLTAIVYLWSREFADSVLSVFGLFQVQGFYWPWVLVAIRVLMGGSPVDDLLGIFVGHVYYFLEDIQNIKLQAPTVLTEYLDGHRAAGRNADRHRTAFGGHNWGGGGQRLGG